MWHQQDRFRSHHRAYLKYNLLSPCCNISHMIMCAISQAIFIPVALAPVSLISTLICMYSTVFLPSQYSQKSSYQQVMILPCISTVYFMVRLSVYPSHRLTVSSSSYPSSPPSEQLKSPVITTVSPHSRITTYYITSVPRYKTLRYFTVCIHQYEAVCHYYYAPSTLHIAVLKCVTI